MQPLQLCNTRQLKAFEAKMRWKRSATLWKVLETLLVLMNINAVVPDHFKFKVSSVAEKPYKVFNHSPPIWQVFFPFSPFQFSCFQTFKKNISLTCRHKFRKKMTKLQFTATWVIQQVFHKRCQTNSTVFLSSSLLLLLKPSLVIYSKSSFSNFSPPSLLTL